MIRINLLPYRDERKKDVLLQQIIIGAVPLMLTIIVVAFLWWSVKSDIANAENEIVRIKNEIKKQEGTIKKIDEFKKKKKILTKKMEIINTLQDGKNCKTF